MNEKSFREVEAAIELVHAQIDDRTGIQKRSIDRYSRLVSLKAPDEIKLQELTLRDQVQKEIKSLYVELEALGEILLNCSEK